MSPDPEIILQDGDLVAGIAVRGAELRLLRAKASGHCLLWSGDPQWWSFVAPILFPIVGKLPLGYLEHRGHKLALSPHGFARTSSFVVQERQTHRVRLTLAASELTLFLYPFDFLLEVEFTIGDGELRQTVTVHNRGTESMPASFGFHPAFRWPCTVGQADRGAYRLEFAMPQTGGWFRCGVTGCLEPIDPPFGTPAQDLALNDDLFIGGALVIDAVAGQAVSVFDGQQRLFDLHWSGCSQLGLWSLPGAPFFCIEPWQGHPPPRGALNTLMDKPGGFHLMPGECRRFSLTIRPAPGQQP